jgi:hypothetical protein
MLLFIEIYAVEKPTVQLQKKMLRYCELITICSMKHNKQLYIVYIASAELFRMIMSNYRSTEQYSKNNKPFGLMQTATCYDF